MVQKHTIHILGEGGNCCLFATQTTCGLQDTLFTNLWSVSNFYANSFHNFSLDCLTIVVAVLCTAEYHNQSCSNDLFAGLGSQAILKEPELELEPSKFLLAPAPNNIFFTFKSNLINSWI